MNMEIAEPVLFNIVNELLGLLSSSSSSSSKSEDDDQHQVPRLRDIRIQNFVEDVVESYSDAEFRENFRMYRLTFNYILNIIQDEIATSIDATGRHTVLAKNQLLIAIWRLSTPDSYRSICSRFNIGKATAIRIVRRVTQALVNVAPQFVRWPNEEEVNRIQQSFARKGFPQTIGCIDGTFIKIPQPKENGRSYICRKGFAALILQGVCDDKLQFLHTVAGEVGSCHDARVLKNSEVWTYVTRDDENKFPGDTHLVGDKAYPIIPRIMTPFKNNGHLTEAQNNFNYLLSCVRSSVERAFALLKKRFRCLNFLDVQDLVWGVKYIIACTVLHNICILQNVALQVDIEEIEDDNEDAFDFIENNERRLYMLGTAKRNRLCQELALL